MEPYGEGIGEGIVEKALCCAFDIFQGVVSGALCPSNFLIAVLLVLCQQNGTLENHLCTAAQWL